MMNTISDTYALASRARSKLHQEASKPDFNLRVLVSHANLLDNLSDRIQKYKDDLQNEPLINYKNKIITNNVKFSPLSSTVTVIKEDDFDDDDEEEEGDDEEASEIIYDSNEISSDDESDEADWDDFSDDDDEEEYEQGEIIQLTKVTSSNYRELHPTDDIEGEDEDLESLSDYESDEDEESTPSLNYSSDEDEDEDEDEELELNKKSTEFWSKVATKDLLAERNYLKRIPPIDNVSTITV
ncbi:hypothetical protein WICMUC_004496 [Wickerhamomyces mucosus]|uniref:Uncharacterized protein n=1 Tax=Wickerhamomyces mucosus TaxID=1378264 RepID=A0A9P8TAU7_9ASCO|nr:hypothetical protein WICMUC_004496 [Wickerhamomyces mucosus]